ncbi:hypothetical protein KP509_26G062900 [Ceratopteris richardii]|uniref:Uncharacterized protein n=1 Tax=Ceratopteris richardii TaxID=49495 RepID=A0A8T2RP95_CERRI|nr:hypothetical protein KP509_26G062900 [Ceratopteris richardii]
MALSDTWMKEFEEAAKLAHDITGRLREREIIQSTGGDPSHLIISTRRKITILGICLGRMESLLQNPPKKPILMHLTEIVPPKQAMKTRHGVGDAAETASPNQAMTTKHRVVDVIDESSLQERLLNGGIDASDSQSKGDDDDKGSSGSCNMQLSCLIILGVLVLVLLVWTIIKIW